MKGAYYGNVKYSPNKLICTIVAAVQYTLLVNCCPGGVITIIVLTTAYNVLCRNSNREDTFALKVKDAQHFHGLSNVFCHRNYNSKMKLLERETIHLCMRSSEFVRVYKYFPFRYNKVWTSCRRQWRSVLIYNPVLRTIGGTGPIWAKTACFDQWQKHSSVFIFFDPCCYYRMVIPKIVRKWGYQKERHFRVSASSIELLETGKPSSVTMNNTQQKVETIKKVNFSCKDTNFSLKYEIFFGLHTASPKIATWRIRHF